MSGGLQLQTAVQNLYRAFSAYPLRKHVEGCPCCVGTTEQRALESAPLHELSVEALGLYSFKAMTTWGDAEDFKHFLPRIFELVVAPAGLSYNTEIILGKLALAEWKEWSQGEQTAVRDFLRAQWNHLLVNAQFSEEPESWLCGTACAGEDLSIYLEDWISARSANAYSHLSEFIEDNQPRYIRQHSLSNAFWPANPEGVKQVCEWAQNPETKKQLEKIYFENISADYAKALSGAIERLEWIANSNP